jgi:hyaluronoglucosaminidase
MNKLFGVVEGFYRRPYRFEQRLDLVDFLAKLGLNTYVYGPKADPYHRREWRKPYPKQKLLEFARLNDDCRKKHVRFFYALSPMRRPELPAVLAKIARMLDIGISRFCIFFDDIRVPLTATTAQKQVHIINGLYEYLQSKTSEPSLLFCPTQYRGFKRTQYLDCVAYNTHPEVHIFWTGKYVVSPRITEKDIARITEMLGRPVLIWDNIFANDYIPGKILRFPYRYRSPGILRGITGILINPMNNYLASKPLIYTAAQFFRDPLNYHPTTAWKQATDEKRIAHLRSS